MKRKAQRRDQLKDVPTLSKADTKTAAKFGKAPAQLTQSRLDRVWKDLQSLPQAKCTFCKQPIFRINGGDEDGICMECAGIIEPQTVYHSGV